MRRRLQRRNKRIDQNRRLQERQERRRAALANFEVGRIENITARHLENLARDPLCISCGAPVTGEEILARAFAGFEAKRTKNNFFCHLRHICEPDGISPVPEMEQNLKDIYMKIFEKEEGHLFIEQTQKKENIKNEPLL